MKLFQPTRIFALCIKGIISRVLLTLQINHSIVCLLLTDTDQSNNDDMFNYRYAKFIIHGHNRTQCLHVNSIFIASSIEFVFDLTSADLEN